MNHREESAHLETPRLYLAKHAREISGALVELHHRNLHLESHDLMQTPRCASEHLQVKSLRVDLQEGHAVAPQGEIHLVEAGDPALFASAGAQVPLLGPKGAGQVEGVVVRVLVVLQRGDARYITEGDVLDAPARVAGHPAAELAEGSLRGLEADDVTSIAHLLAQDRAELAFVRPDIKNEGDAVPLDDAPEVEGQRRRGGPTTNR